MNKLLISMVFNLYLYAKKNIQGVIMNDNKELKILLTKMEYHIEEEISFINEICSENFSSYDNETIGFYIILRDLFRNYKKEFKKLLKELEQRKDNI